MNPLQQVSEHLRKHKDEKTAVVFDLDSTLFCVSPRTQAIMQEMIRHPEFRAKFQREAEILRDLEVLPSDWGIKSALLRHQVSNDVEFFKHVRDYWRKYFFSNHFLDRDQIYPSANEYVRHLDGLGAQIRYLTGRSRGSMEEGTLRALRFWNFPLADHSHLMMKPSDVETDESFKAVVLKEMSHDFDHIWLFENEPVIIDLVRVQAPLVHIVFVNSVHSGRLSAPTDLLTIAPDYRSGVYLPK